MTVQFGNRIVGDGQPCFITFEAGPTHDGLESAKRLVGLAAQAGADAVKFQMVDPDRLVADRKMPFSYDVLVDRATGRTETVEEPLYDILCRRALTPDEWRDLKAECDRLKIAFFATAAFEDEIELLQGLGCASIKIASADVNHVPLLRLAARTGLCLQLDTGNASLGEIEVAVDVIRSEGNENIIIHHCPSGYPAKAEGVNLRVIQTLRQLFPYPVAYSDHVPGWDMDIAAVVMGASLLEKTITEDRTTRSVEHTMSLEPGDMRAFIAAIRHLERALGSPRRIMSPVEIERRQRIRRSAHLRRDLPAGHVLALADLEFRRPGDGMPPDRVDEIVGRALTVAKAAGDRLRPQDLAW